MTNGSHEALTAEDLAIIKTLIAMPSPGDALAVQNIRKTLRRLGEAIENLPSQPTENIFVDAAALRNEATQLAAKAQSGSDPAVAASWERQAEALTRRAETITRTVTLVRRNQTLREEVAAQVKTFQTSLAAAQINSSQMSGDFAALAVSVAQVAQEADALADACAELDTALGQSRTTVEPVTLAATDRPALNRRNSNSRWRTFP